MRWRGLRLLALLNVGLFVTGCAVEPASQTTELIAPFVTGVSVSGNDITVSYLYYNYEDFFSGIVIYLTTTLIDAQQEESPIRVNDGYNDGDAPTVSYKPVAFGSSATGSFTFNGKLYNNMNLTSSLTYYVYIKSYSSYYSVYSAPSLIYSFPYTDGAVGQNES